MRLATFGNDDFRRRCWRRDRFGGGFTLIELVVVIGIIAVLAAIGLPGISRMWEDSRLADTQNRLKGMMASARARALNTQEAGIFFYLDNGVQKGVFIETEPPTSAELQSDPNFVRAATHRFVVDDEIISFAAPFRVVPRSTLDRIIKPPPQWLWTPDELANNNYQDMTFADADGNGAHNHRNFFTVIFSPEGKLVHRDVVLIHDPADTSSGEVPGEITGLTVDDATHYQDRLGEFDGGTTLLATLPAMIVSTSNVTGSDITAINFPSVDGLLVVDDSVLKDFPADSVDETVRTQRDYLAETARPYYVSRQTGSLIEGPRFESDVN